jgi:hypothetical protein
MYFQRKAKPVKHKISTKHSKQSFIDPIGVGVACFRLVRERERLSQENAQQEDQRVTYLSCLWNDPCCVCRTRGKMSGSW